MSAVVVPVVDSVVSDPLSVSEPASSSPPPPLTAAMAIRTTAITATTPTMIHSVRLSPPPPPAARRWAWATARPVGGPVGPGAPWVRSTGWAPPGHRGRRAHPARRAPWAGRGGRPPAGRGGGGGGGGG